MRKRIKEILLDYRPSLNPYSFGKGGHIYVHFYRKYEDELDKWGASFESFYEANLSDMERLKYVIRKKDGNL